MSVIFSPIQQKVILSSFSLKRHLDHGRYILSVKLECQQNALGKVGKMHINVSQWDMLAVALFGGNKGLDHFLESFH